MIIRRESNVTQDMVDIDGAMGEGGGQVVRTSLSLSLVTGTPLRIRNIRAGRKRPGLLRQHLTALQAATEVGSAEVEGAALGAREIVFRPRRIAGGDFEFAVGTAGSTTLVLQTILPALMQAERESDIVIEGGTHNPHAPPFDFLDRVFLPLLRRMGVEVRASLERPGFFPAGGGRIRVRVQPADRLKRIDLLERGEIVNRRAIARVCNLPRQIAERELATIRGSLSWEPSWLEAEEVRGAAGPGNVVTVEIGSEHVTELFTGFGRVDARAERVGKEAAREVRDYLAAGVPVGPYLADQLLIPMAIAGGGSFRTITPTRHCRTNVDVVRAFLDVRIDCVKEDRNQWRIEVEQE